MHPFTKRFHESVSALGEEKLIAALRRWLGRASPKSPFGIGDDAFGGQRWLERFAVGSDRVCADAALIPLQLDVR